MQNWLPINHPNKDLPSINICVHDNNVKEPDQVIIALHGFTGSGLDFDPIVDLLPKKTLFIAPDLIGHGESDCPRNSGYYSEPFIFELISGIQKRYRLPHFHLLGYSLGGRLALRYSLHSNKCLDSLILISSTPGIKVKQDRLERKYADKHLAQNITERGISWFCKEWEKIPILRSQKNIPPEIMNPLRERKLKNNITGLSNTLEHLSNGNLMPVWDNLSTITTPTYLFTGADDLKFTEIAKQMKTLIPLSTHSIIPNTGHLPHLESLKAFSQSLNSIILPK